MGRDGRADGSVGTLAGEHDVVSSSPSDGREPKLFEQYMCENFSDDTHQAVEAGEKTSL